MATTYNWSFTDPNVNITYSGTFTVSMNEWTNMLTVTAVTGSYKNNPIIAIYPFMGDTTYNPVNSTVSFNVSLNQFDTFWIRVYNIGNEDGTFSTGVTEYYEDGSEQTYIYNRMTISSNSAPTDISLNNLSIVENNSINAVVGTLSTTDPDPGNTHTYTLVGGATGAFDISGNLLLAKIVFDYEVDQSYNVTVRSTDQDGLFLEESFTITVINQQSPIVGLTGPSSVTQGVVNTYTATVKYETTNNNFITPIVIPSTMELFINYNAFENPSEYTVATIKQGAYNNFSELSTSLIHYKGIYETPSEGRTLFNFFNLTLYYDTSANLFSIDDITQDNKINFKNDSSESFNALINAQAHDENFLNAMSNYYKYDAENHDQESNAYLSDSFELIGTTLNDASGNVDLYINGVLGQTQILDASGSATFDVSFNTVPSASVKAVYQAQGILDASESQVLNVTVASPNSAPIITPTTISVAENTNSVQLQATDSDVNDTLTWSLVAGTGDSSNNVFDISASTGILTLKSGNFDYETQTTYSVRVQVSDGTATDTEIITITVTDVNEGPVTLTLPSISASSKEYDGTTGASANVTLGALTGIQNGDTVNATLISATYNNENVGSNKTITVDVSLNGAQASNYTIVTPITISNAVITAKSITATVTGVNKPFDNNTNASVNVSLNNVVQGDDVSVNVVSASFANATSGENKTINVVLSLTGADAGNYTLSNSTTTTTATIIAPPTPGSIGAPFGITGGRVSSEILSLNTGSSFYFTDSYANLTQEAKVYKQTTGALGNTGVTGPQVSVVTGVNNRNIVFSSVPNEVTNAVSIGKDFSMIFKVFDNSGNILPVLSPAMTIDIYLDRDISANVILTTNGTNGAGRGTRMGQVGNKWRYRVNLTRGDGLLQGVGDDPEPSAGSDPHITTIFGTKYDFHPSTRKNYTLFKTKEIKVGSHFTGLKNGIFYDRVDIELPGKEKMEVDFNKQKIRGKSKWIEVKEKSDEIKIKYNNTTYNKTMGKTFEPRNMTKLSYKGKTPMDMYIDYQTRYVHFRFPDNLPDVNEMSGLIVDPATRLD
jgi:hypothetical protein